MLVGEGKAGVLHLTGEVRLLRDRAVMVESHSGEIEQCEVRSRQ